MMLDEEKIKLLVNEEARRLMLAWTAVEPLASVIVRQWYMYGHWDFFAVNSRRLRLLDEPREKSTECLWQCLQIIKKNPSAYLMAEIRSSDEDTSGSTDSPEQIPAETLPTPDP